MRELDAFCEALRKFIKGKVLLEMSLESAHRELMSTPPLGNIDAALAKGKASHIDATTAFNNLVNDLEPAIIAFLGESRGSDEAQIDYYARIGRMTEREMLQMQTRNGIHFLPEGPWEHRPH